MEYLKHTQRYLTMIKPNTNEKRRQLPSWTSEMKNHTKDVSTYRGDVSPLLPL